MSVQPPPSNPNSPVYNPINYVNPTSSSGIDVAFLDANYLKFPTAQGSEDFTNGLFSTDTIDFNSATGANRAITGLSKSEFSDILGNASYTASIEENSTAIGIYDGGLVITSSNSINLVGADVLLNGVPITTGGGDVFLAGNNTFTGTNDFTSTFTIDNTQTNIGQLPTGNNTAIGLATLGDITTGDNNSAFGYTSLQALTTGSYNTGLGYACLSNSLTDDNNTAVGYWSGQQLNGGGNNTYLGYESGYNQTTGNGNVAIGYQSGVDVSAPTLSNTIAIGNGITSVATGDMIFGFSQYSPPNDYWAKFTPNTSFQGITLQGTYNGSSNFTIDAPNSSVALNSTNIDLNASNTITISSILQSPNNPNINILNSGQGTFYVSSQNPYFAYNNVGTITSQQLVNTTTLSTYAPLASPLFSGIPTAPTALSTDNSTQLATTAFVQSVVNSGSAPTPIATIISGSPSNSGGITTWIFTGPNQPAGGGGSSPPYGNTFNYIVYVNTPPPLQNIVDAGNQVNLNSGVGVATGTGVATTYLTPANPSVPVYAYVLSNSITALGLILNYQKTINQSGNNFAFYFTSTTNSSNTLTIKIYPTS
jgi:hypothetical protein